MFGIYFKISQTMLIHGEFASVAAAVDTDHKEFPGQARVPESHRDSEGVSRLVIVINTDSMGQFNCRS